MNSISLWDHLALSCFPNPCLNSGVCYIDMYNVATCSCTAGWTGSICETVIMATTTSTLPPGKSTMSKEIIFVIHADIHWFVHSDLGGSFCAFYPCQNGGTCYENTDTYRCECILPWSGPTCVDWSVTISPPGTSTISPGKLSANFADLKQ